jgi:DNA-binding NarL/FixJ family response regulator
MPWVNKNLYLKKLFKPFLRHKLVMKALIFDSNPITLELVKSKVSKSKQVSEIYSCNSAKKFSHLIETKNPQVVFVNQEIANKIKRKHQISNRRFVLVVEPNQMPELDHKALQIVDALIQTKATDLEYQILISALKLEMGKSRPIHKLTSPKGTPPRLTPREIQILHYLSLGKSVLAISNELQVGLPTVKTHERRIFSKLRVRNRTHGVAQGIRWNII